jgi:hypothetical protein
VSPCRAQVVEADALVSQLLSLNKSLVADLARVRSSGGGSGLRGSHSARQTLRSLQAIYAALFPGHPSKAAMSSSLEREKDAFQVNFGAERAESMRTREKDRLDVDAGASKGDVEEILAEGYEQTWRRRPAVGSEGAGGKEREGAVGGSAGRAKLEELLGGGDWESGDELDGSTVGAGGGTTTQQGEVGARPRLVVGSNGERYDSEGGNGMEHVDRLVVSLEEEVRALDRECESRAQSRRQEAER